MTAEIERPEQAALVAFDAEFAKRRGALESSAASMIDPDRLRGVVLAQFSRTPALWECDPVTVVRAVIEAAQVGLEPTGAIGGAHLVPRWNSKTRRNEATLVFDYRGLVTLAKRSSEVARVTARLVREADEFAYQQGTDEWIRHVPALVPDPGSFAFVYAVAHYRDGGSQFDVMSAAEIEVIRQRHAPRDREKNIVGPWISDPGEMWKKTVLRRLCKLLPLTIEARQAIAFEDEQTPSTPIVRVDRAATLRKQLQARLAPVAELPPGQPEATEDASDDSAEDDATCGNVAADGLMAGAICTEPPHDKGPHKNDAGSWPR